MLAKSRIKALERELYNRAMEGDSRTGLALLRLFAVPQPTQHPGNYIDLPPVIRDDES